MPRASKLTRKQEMRLHIIEEHPRARIIYRTEWYGLTLKQLVSIHELEHHGPSGRVHTH